MSVITAKVWCLVSLLRVDTGIKTIEVETRPGMTLMEALHGAGIAVAGDCGGFGTCGKCRLRAWGGIGAPSPVEIGELRASELAAGWRLACSARIEGDCQVLLTQSGLDDHSGLPIDDDPVRYLAVDLGSTTIAVGLADGEGHLMKRIQVENPQVIYGSDVVSRLSWALKNDDNRHLLRRIVINALNRIFTGIDTNQMQSLCLVGNPVMIHLLVGAEVSGLASYPYRGAIDGAMLCAAEEMELALPKHTPVYLPPAAGAYVGSDALVGALSLRPRDRFILVDLGTNAEVIACAGERWIAVSAAAGPALEGACIYQGMRAQPGAISSAHWGHGRLELQVIGGGEPRGICGTGLVQLIARLKNLGVIDDDGLINMSPDLPIAVGTGSQGREVILYEGRDHKVVLTQEDIRQFQLAKAAVRVAIDTLVGYLPGVDWQGIYLAGALGSNVSVDALKYLGMLPDLSGVPVLAAGNTALQGAARAASDQAFRRQAERIAGQVEVMELANQPGFQEAFLRQLQLGAV